MTRASAREPLIGVLLLLDARAIMQTAADLELPQPRRIDLPRAVSVEVVDRGLLDAFVRLVRLLGEPEMLPRLSPLIVQEITIRLLTGPTARNYAISQLWALRVSRSPRRLDG